MLSIFLGFCFIVSILSAFLLGRAEELTLAVMDGAQTAVNLSIAMCGMMAFWQGILNLAQKSEFCDKIAKLLYPFLHIVFPKLKKGSKEMELISMNVTANMLGIGNAATPFGISALKELKKKDKAAEIELLVLLNTASVQIIPTTAAILRKEYASSAPFSIIPLVLAVSSISLVVSLIIYKCLK